MDDIFIKIYARTGARFTMLKTFDAHIPGPLRGHIPTVIFQDWGDLVATHDKPSW